MARMVAFPIARTTGGRVASRSRPLPDGRIASKWVVGEETI